MLIKVKVFAGSKKVAVIKKADDSFEVRVREKAERGMANRAVAAALASYLKLPYSQVRLIRGARQKNKIFSRS